MGISPGLDAFKLAFELSPIILTGGIAGPIPGGMLPIVSITEALNFTDGLLSGGADLGLDSFFAHFIPLPGGSMVDQQVGKYPFANQSVAANATISQPLVISLRMVCPVKEEGGYAVKLAIMTALQATLRQHNSLGGTYTVATPSLFYTNCILLGVRDTSSAASHQAQNTWQWDFEKPLLTLEDAVAAQNSLMSKITAGTAIPGTPTWSGLGPTVGNPASLGTIGVVPASDASFGAGTASPLGGIGHA